MKSALRPTIGRYILEEVVPVWMPNATTPIFCATSWSMPRKPRMEDLPPLRDAIAHILADISNS